MVARIQSSFPRRLPVKWSSTGWRQRIDQGEATIFTDFCDEVGAVLDDLQATRASAVGLSRGAYVAAICTARDPRFHSLAMLAPVTDLSRLEG